MRRKDNVQHFRDPLGSTSYRLQALGTVGENIYPTKNVSTTTCRIIGFETAVKNNNSNSGLPRVVVALLCFALGQSTRIRYDLHCRKGGLGVKRS